MDVENFPHKKISICEGSEIGGGMRPEEKLLREGTEGKWRGPVYALIATKNGRETERDRLHKRRHCIHSKGQSKEQRSLY
jgi:hypothetical protein